MEEQLQGDRVHPLLLPSVVSVLAEHLHQNELVRYKLVCKLWNNAIKKKTSPLLNPRILSNVINFLQHSCFRTFRLVCSLWNTTLINSYRWKNPSIDETQWSSYFPQFRLGSDDFQRFSDKFGDPNDLPLPLAFTHFSAPNNISLSDPDTQGFLDTYGRFIKYVELYRCKWSLEDLRNLLFKWAVNLESFKVVCGVLPGTQVGRGRKVTVAELKCVLHEDPSDFPFLDKVKRFHIDMNILDSKDNVRAYVEQFFIEFFGSAKNLEVINFDFSSWYARSWATNFISSCEDVKLGKLRVLEHLIDPDLQGVRNLRLKHFPLTHLKIRIRYRDVTLEELHDLLTSLKNTLTDLQVVFVEYTCAREFPSSNVLGKLKKLELWKFKGQLGFLHDFSCLEELVLGEIELKGQDVFCRREVFGEVLRGVKVVFKDYWEGRVFS